MGAGIMPPRLAMATNYTADEQLAEFEEGDDEYTPYSERAETYVVPIVFAIIFLVGVLGNGSLIVIFVRHRIMRNIPNTYIFSLACADMLVICICLPLASVIYIWESWPFGGWVCALAEFLKDLSIGVSVFTLTALAGERYFAIVNPLRKFQSRSFTVMTAVLIWLASMGLAAPDLVRSDAVVYVNNATNQTIAYCSPFGAVDDPFTPVYTKFIIIAKSVVYYFGPLAVIGTLYLMMAHRLHMSARDIPGELVGPQSKAQARARRHVARMVQTFIWIFFLCFAPHHLFMLWFHLCPTSREDYDEFWHVLRIFGFCMSFLNSCVNPCALYCVSGLFRQHFEYYLCCKTMASAQRSGMSTAGAASAVEPNTCHSTIRRKPTYRTGAGQSGSRSIRIDGGVGGGVAGDAEGSDSGSNSRTSLRGVVSFCDAVDGVAGIGGGCRPVGGQRQLHRQQANGAGRYNGQSGTGADLDSPTLGIELGDGGADQRSVFELYITSSDED